jgi:glyoxylase-like metal-dependent hydrolase (beta-lactamase superfamily II)
MSETWTDLGGGVHVRQSAAFQMNSALLLHPEHAILVDPGVLATELDDIAAGVTAARPAKTTLLLTHGHWDHVLGRPWWPNAEVVAHDRFAAVVKRDEAKIRREIEELAQEHGQSWERGFTPFRPAQAVSGLHLARRGPWTLVLRDAFGHSDSQLSIHLPHERVLLAADMLSDIEIPLMGGPVAPYLDTLRALAPLAENGAIERLVPGHGSIARGRAEVALRVRRDIEYLESLARELARVRAAKLDAEAAKAELLSIRYGGAPMPEWALEQHRGNLEVLLR